MPVPALPNIIIDPIVRLALSEDLGRAGDLTSDALFGDETCSAQILTRQSGTLAALGPAIRTMQLIDQNVDIVRFFDNGDRVSPKETILSFHGSVRSILMAERTMLNFLGRGCGIASQTHAYVKKLDGTNAQLVCTRKTMPGHRSLDKHAVRCGGGIVHRYGLDDAVLIKDNHIAATGSIKETLKRAFAYAGHLRMIEIEVDTLEQLDEVLVTSPLPHAILLDNMSPTMLTEAVGRVDGRTKTESSGGINLDTIEAIAATGVDFISVGALTHSVTNFDLSMEF